MTRNNFEKKCVLFLLVISLFAGIIVDGSADNKDRNIQLVSLERLKNHKGRDDSGDCGANVHWTFESSTGVLTFSGTGEMDNFTFWGYSPFLKHKDSINSVVIEAGITSIGLYAFNGFTKLTSISIPNSVTSIESFAFKGCSGLTSINIPDSVISIGSSAFFGCSELTSINIPNSVTSIGSYAFKDSNNIVYECENGACYLGNEGNKYHALIKAEDEAIVSCVVNDDTVVIAGGAFSSCSKLTSISIPDSIIYIGPDTFSGCSELTSIHIPDAVTSIGSSTFEGCRGLSSINIPASVTFIGMSAFRNCSGLTSVTIPDAVTDIESNTFDGCSGLTSINIPDSITSIAEYAFKNCSGLKSVSIPSSVTSIEYDAFEGCNNISYECENGACYLGNEGNKYHALIRAENSSIASCVVHDGTVVIVGGAFEDCFSLKSVDIPDSVVFIGSSAFYCCSQLTSIYIPNSVTSIGSRAFEYCRKLTSANIPDSVTSIEEGVFQYCYELTSISIPDSVTSIGPCAFSSCKSLTSMNIPNSVTSIGSNAFYRSGLTSIFIPENVSLISSQAFAECTSLKSVFYQGSYSDKIYSLVFADDTALEDICVPPYYNYTHFGGSPVTSDTANCILFRNMFNKCYLGTFIDNEMTAVKRKEFIEFEKQRTGCIERTCDNDTGLVSWSLCNSTQTKILACVNDQCVQVEDRSLAFSGSNKHSYSDGMTLFVLFVMFFLAWY